MKISFLYSAIARKIVLGISALLCLFLMFSCDQKKEADTRMEHVVAVHDSVMPKMSRIGELITRLKPLADSTENGQTYQRAMEELQEANKSMMQWMQGFGDRFDYAEIMEGKELSPEKSVWLDEELIKVEEMAEKVNGSIDRAELLLEKAPPLQ
ncbi:hypothetical protein [Robiginitalea aurantiaca]|uniref:Viral A-type inclusion protein n=1 Tax=Robiginitalea aurantiaca TaxID=3056915 RepID=A0ABT7WEI9_9FLAO|nr:hypothetical protein [Robiginitalea aurantiaca]MDM9631334.1 hypothetical protein [Robiginitalea aurantiaca]